jgi:hypothetical protein
VSTETEYSALKLLHAAARLLPEGGRPVVLLPAFSFRAAGRDQKMDLLLVPWEHSGYATRLFYQNAISERGQNWTQHCVIDRNWWAPSYNGVLTTLPWREILCAHIRSVA